MGNTWGHDGVGLGGGFRGPAWWNEAFKVTLGDTGLGHGVGLGAVGWVYGTSGGKGVGRGRTWAGLADQHGGTRPPGQHWGARGWDMWEGLRDKLGHWAGVG